MSNLELGSEIKLHHLVEVARGHRKVAFSDEYIKRVENCRQLVEKFIEEERVIYGITTGLGDNCNVFIKKQENKIIQINTLRSHAMSLGEPLNEECVRAIMFTMLQSFGLGYSGIRLETVTLIKDLLNHNIIPYCPKHGSVGYLNVEANIGLVLIGEGNAYYNGNLIGGKEVLDKAGLKPIEIGAKEGLTIVSGTSSTTALTSLALYDAMTIAKTNDVSGAMSLEVLKGQLMAMDERLMAVRPHVHQGRSAANIRRILEDSQIIEVYKNHRVQDALSLRSMPQVHGAIKKQLADALSTIETELNASVDNPQIFGNSEDGGVVIMGCNADATYIGLEADSICIAMTTMSKMSERRIDRMVNRHVSELPPFLAANPGVNNGLMIPQYSAAGILGELRIISHPATIDTVITSSLQEDYASMGYNAALKAYKSVELARYILAIELFNAVQAQDFYEDLSPSSATKAVYNLIREDFAYVEEDRVMFKEIEQISDMVKREEIVNKVEDVVGKLEF